MANRLQSRPDLLLLLSLLLAILLTPVLDHDGWRRLVLAVVTFMLRERIASGTLRCRRTVIAGRLVGSRIGADVGLGSHAVILPRAVRELRPHRTRYR